MLALNCRMAVTNLNVTYDVLTRGHGMGQTEQKTGKEPTATILY
jgi:hypothetical protein